MAENPQPARYAPRTDILTLGDAFFDSVVAADFPQTTLRYRNDRAGDEIGLTSSRTPAQAGAQGQVEPTSMPHALDPRLRGRTETEGRLPLTDDQWITHFARFQPLPGSLPQPLALRYHGHQFQHYNPDIGDGRGFLFAQAEDGAGRTRTSRRGCRRPW